MDNIHLLQAFVAECGGKRQAAEKANLGYELLRKMVRGERSVSLTSARRIERASQGRYRAADLLGLDTGKGA